MATNSLDAVLAQYEKAKSNTGGSKISQEDRMKKYFAAILPQGKSQGKRDFESYLLLTVRHRLKKYGSTKFKLLVNGIKSMTLAKMTMSVHL